MKGGLVEQGGCGDVTDSRGGIVGKILRRGSGEKSCPG